MVSKCIGETENNLGNDFISPQYQSGIFFFDGADTLPGRRSETRHTHARYAQAAAGFLLQRIEDFALRYCFTGKNRGSAGLAHPVFRAIGTSCPNAAPT